MEYEFYESTVYSPGGYHPSTTHPFPDNNSMVAKMSPPVISNNLIDPILRSHGDAHMDDTYLTNSEYMGSQHVQWLQRDQSLDQPVFSAGVPFPAPRHLTPTSHGMYSPPQSVTSSMDTSDMVWGHPSPEAPMSPPMHDNSYTYSHHQSQIFLGHGNNNFETIDLNLVSPSTEIHEGSSTFPMARSVSFCSESSYHSATPHSPLVPMIETSQYDAPLHNRLSPEDDNASKSITVKPMPVTTSRNLSRKRPTTNRSNKKRPNSTPPKNGGKKAKRDTMSPGISSVGPAIRCHSCATPCEDDADLERHVKQQHAARPFTCVFGFAGCPSRFVAKNEWKRHVSSQHLLLHFWKCTEPTCVDAFKETQGAIFNRKDLYTQHVRRMHVPPVHRKALKTRKNIPEWDDQLKEMQEKALRRRCELPTLLRCPATTTDGGSHMPCPAEFSGPNAWDDRMEHVARHLEKAALGEEPEVVFGGESTDPTLNAWAAAEHVRIIRRRASGGDQWELARPLKTSSQVGQKAKTVPACSDSDADADYEEE